jgi:hypothetical protein
VPEFRVVRRKKLIYERKKSDARRKTLLTDVDL